MRYIIDRLEEGLAVCENEQKKNNNYSQNNASE